MGRGLPACAQTDAHTLVPYLSKLPSRAHLWLPARRNVPDGARTSGSGRSRLGEEAGRGSAGEVTLSHCTLTPPTCESHGAGPRHLHSAPLHRCLHPPTLSAPVSASREPQICKTRGLCRKQPLSPGGSHLQKLHPAQPAALGRPCRDLPCSSHHPTFPEPERDEAGTSWASQQDTYNCYTGEAISNWDLEALGVCRTPLCQGASWGMP